MQCSNGLSTIHGVDPAKIHEFHEKLTSHIQVLETMGKVKEIGGFMRATLDKLPDIRADLVHLDDDWQEWGFPELIESLRKWCSCNPIPSRDQSTVQQTVVHLSVTPVPRICHIVTLETAIHQRKTLPTKPRMKVRRWHVSVSIVIVKIIALQSVGSS